MPKIKIKRDDKIEQIQVSDHGLSHVLDIVKDDTAKGTTLIEVDGINFLKKDFKGYVQASESVDEYDLSNKEHRKEIEAFGQELEIAKATMVLERELEYYGDLPMSDEDWDRHYNRMVKTYKFSDKLIPSEKRTMTKELGFVKNPILGTVHWSEVAKAENDAIITRNHGGAWFIKVDDSVGRQMGNAKKFDIYKNKRRAWEAMKRSRANYADQVKENEVIESLTVEGIDF